MNKLHLEGTWVDLVFFIIAAILCSALVASAATTKSTTITPTTTADAMCKGLGYVLPTTTPSPTPSPTPPPTPSPAPAPTPSPTPPAAGSISLSDVYLTFYSEADNTPAGSNRTDLGGHTGTLGGNCTYANPTTMAVGFSLAGGKETDDFAYGTKFYVPKLQCYFVAADQCGDTSSPQTQPCHQLHSSKADNNAPAGATLWLDAYEGPNNSCEDNLTDLYSVIENPAAGLPVKTGNICN